MSVQHNTKFGKFPYAVFLATHKTQQTDNTLPSIFWISLSLYSCTFITLLL